MSRISFDPKIVHFDLQFSYPICQVGLIFIKEELDEAHVQNPGKTMDKDNTHNLLEKCAPCGLGVKNVGFYVEGRPEFQAGYIFDGNCPLLLSEVEKSSELLAGNWSVPRNTTRSTDRSSITYFLLKRH